MPERGSGWHIEEYMKSLHLPEEYREYVVFFKC